MIKIYKGKLEQGDHGDSMDVLFIEGASDPLLEMLQDDIERYGSYLTVRYFVMDRDIPVSEIEECYFMQLIGAGRSEFQPCYSEVTGYLYTNEELIVGGHDLLKELESSVGKYILIEVKFDREPP